MKKIIFEKYGDVDVLEQIECEAPNASSLSADQLLIQVKAVSINPLDWKIQRGEMRLLSGSRFPKGVGIDFSGVVLACGKAVTEYMSGDAVFGALDAFKGGALAEVISAKANQLCKMPVQISFEPAAAIPIVGSSALTIFDELVELKPNLEMLINGATGGIGMIATQIAAKHGVKVTAVASAAGIPFLQRWGASTIINYREQNVLNLDARFDAVLDLAGTLPFEKAKSIMKPQSVYVNTTPGFKEILRALLHRLGAHKKYKVLMSKLNATTLVRLAKMADEGLDIVIGRNYPMDAFRNAYTEVPKGGIVGKSVFTL
jgi:NADPH:quinone reductase-like Zn-dependent oxidoreductase